MGCRCYYRADLGVEGQLWRIHQGSIVHLKSGPSIRKWQGSAQFQRSIQELCGQELHNEIQSKYGDGGVGQFFFFSNCSLSLLLLLATDFYLSVCMFLLQLNWHVFKWYFYNQLDLPLLTAAIYNDPVGMKEIRDILLHVCASGGLLYS